MGDIEIRSAETDELIATRHELCPEDDLIVDSSGAHLEPSPGSIFPEVIIFFFTLAVLIVGTVILTRRRRTRAQRATQSPG